ncbi:MAG: hypothetical protein UW63_C0023G0004 [Candidatus Uhrbacteria bacterium GW2011_GWF2_44_350]|uniref:Uncharacterized protein n=1 Tax=Candidatus Uhrbacteria bacterium GW2011_GWF2_44_350 TaxID=1619000 RepID=A0A0G1JH27_9BACT|nr:MAG: hypothetical protein UW63_C0023G0004 [Candidatus Uhrbacteria bacterium GW2011_GWF2_44_350]
MKIKDRLFLPIFNFIGWRAKIFGDMEEAYLKAFLATIARSQAPKETKENETISVSETVSAAASVYENVRNALEYDEEHLLRRNAIRRILKRRFGEEDVISLSSDLLHELIWARYLPNNAVPTKTLDEVAAILRKFQPLFVQAEEAGKNTHHFNLWLLDVLSTEIEYKLSPPLVEEGLVGLVYQNIKSRLEWATSQIKPEDRELQLYVAVHRAVLKSNRATLRYRVFVLYFPDWSKAPTSELVEHVAGRLPQIIETVENQLNHSSGERLLRFCETFAKNIPAISKTFCPTKKDFAKPWPRPRPFVMINSEFEYTAVLFGRLFLSCLPNRFWPYWSSCLLIVW